jgi:hypothetical protein
LVPVPEARDQIIERSDAVPLFVEELVKTVLDRGLLLERDDECLLNVRVHHRQFPAHCRGC